MSPKHRTKGTIIGLSVCVTALVFTFRQAKRSYLMLEEYRRYQDALIGQYITEQNLVPVLTNSFPREPFLVGWTNEFLRNPLGPLVNAMMSDVLDIAVVDAMFLPLLLPIIVIVQALIAREITPDYEWIVFPVAALLSMSLHFKLLHLYSAMHRGAIALILLYTIIFLYLALDSPRGTILIVPLAVALTLSTHTIPIALLVLFVSYDLLRPGNRSRFVSQKTLVLFTTVMMFFGLMTEWVGRVVVKIAAAVRTVLTTSLSIETVVSAVLGASVAISSSAFAEYAYDLPVPLYYNVSIWFLRLFSVLLMTAVGIVVVYRLFNRQYAKRDAFFIAVAIQGVVDLVFMFLFAPTAGISAIVLIFFTAPIFTAAVIVPKVLATGTDNRVKIAVLSVVLLAVVVPGTVVMLQKPVEENKVRTVPDMTYHQTDWAAQYGSQQTVFSDFNTLSAYHALSGPSETYIPPFSLSNADRLQRYIQYYYTDPASVRERASMFIVTEKMTEYAMLHRATIGQPNPELHRLGQSWHKVYDIGNASTYVD